jgi:class 3 adenylate cyclase/tetratricopeptide (TPR) repeat protein
MSGIREWLEGLDLGEYAEAFEAEKIAPEDLTEISEDDLVALGLPLGPRRRVLKAARSLGDEASPNIVAPPPAREAERRQITVMFCDLVGSTALSEQLDPEDLRTLMQAYQQAAGAVVERYQGHVAQYLGDGLMIYFGWPQAHEDDAERAGRAGLEIVDAVKTIGGAPTPLAVRVGIATGPVVVGETGAGDASVPKLAVGETPNLAARMQSLAKPGEVIIAPATFRLVSGVFTYEERGEQSVKGVAEPVLARCVLGEAAVEGRFEAAHGASLTPLVGRDAQVALLLEKWEQACDGEGQVVLLSGEAGIGKSRIAVALRERISDVPHTPLRFQCLPYHANSALYATIEQAERAAGFASDDTTAEKLDKLEALLEQSTNDVAGAAALYAAMLSLDVGDRYPALDMSAEEQRQETFKMLADNLVGLANRKPVLMLYEDAHWIDPTSREWLDLIVSVVAENRILLVITHRPEFQPPWTAYGHVNPIKLTPLGRTTATAMIEKMAGGRPLPDKVLDQIIAKTDGVPLFVEELTKTVLEARTTAEIYIPSTLKDLLTARLDRLAPIREVAQIGACIGRNFSYDLVAAVSPLGEEALRDALRQLVENELVFATGTPPDDAFTFKHALVQDAAYESLLKTKRVHVHRQIADTLESNFLEIRRSQPERLAQHFVAAEQPEDALRYWLHAISMALHKSTYAEADSYIENGIACLHQVHDARARDVLELSLRFLEGLYCRQTMGYASTRAGEAYARAEKLMDTVGAGGTDKDVLVGAGLYHWTQGRLPRAKLYFKRLLEKPGKSDDRKSEILGLFYVGTLDFLTGDAIAGLEMVSRSYEAQSVETGAIAKGHDLRMATGAWLARIQAYAGYPDRAFRLVGESLDNTADLKHPFSATMAYGMAATTAAVLRDNDGMVKWGGECVRLCEEHELPFWAGWARGAQGLALSQAGDTDIGIGEISNAIEMHEANGAFNSTPWLGGYLAEAHLLAGDPEKALELCDRHRAMIGEQQQLFLLPENLVISGQAQLALPRDSDDAVEQAFMEAMKIAQSQGGKLLELRAATHLAKLWRNQGKRDQARDLLPPVYDWFTEGFDTADMKDAKVLLDELN